MDINEIEDRENEVESAEEEITVENIKYALKAIPEQDWINARWPIISYAPFKLLDNYYQENSNPYVFWKQVLDPKNFINPEMDTAFDPKKHFLFAIHSFEDKNGEETKFKAITTTPKSFIEEPWNMINYKHHGFPCENRGGGEYPTLNDFWKDFYDGLSEDDKDRYPIPGKEFRKKLILKKYFNR